MRITTCNIPNKFGITKKIKISDLTEKQLFIQLNNTPMQIATLEQKYKDYKKDNISLDKQRKTNKVNEQILNNTKAMMSLDFTLSFLYSLQNSLVAEYDKRHCSLDRFSNELLEEMFLREVGVSGEVE
jgi:hypothetical protein